MTKKYNIGLALLRIWMCFEVVTDHFPILKGTRVGILDKLLELIFRYGSIAVPIFMISAFLLGGIEYSNDKVKKRIYRLCVPTLFWAVLYFIIYYVFSDFLHVKNYVHGWTDFLWQLLLGHSYNQTLWFQSDLIVLTVLFIILFRFLNYQKALLCCVIFAYVALWLQFSGKNSQMFVGICWPETIWGGYFHKSYVTYPIGRLIEMMPYAVLGIFIGYYKALEKLKKYANYAILGSLLCLQFFFSFSNYFSVPPGYGYEGINRIVIALATLILFYVLPLDRIPKRLKNAIIEVSNHTMAIYFMHRLIGILIYNTRLNLFFDMRKGSVHDCIIIFCFSLVVSLALSKIPIRFIRTSMS